MTSRHHAISNPEDADLILTHPREDIVTLAPRYGESFSLPDGTSRPLAADEKRANKRTLDRRRTLGSAASLRTRSRLIVLSAGLEGTDPPWGQDV